jgi:23S rRNA (pseudouridine1915-N3)-methyltransferase
VIKIKVLAVGKIKEKYFCDAIDEYLKRLKKYCQIEIVEVKDEKDYDDLEITKQIEGKRIIEKLDKTYYNVFLDLKGDKLDSEEFANKIDYISCNHSSKICFVIAGSNGYSKEVLEHANYKVCFSKMTFTHQMIRLFLLEQIYRGFKILNNENYHK